MKRTNGLVVALAVALALGAWACGDATGPHQGIETSPVTPPRRSGVVIQGPQRGISTSPGPQRSGVIIGGPQRGGVIVGGPQRGIETSPRPRP